MSEVSLIAPTALRFQPIRRPQLKQTKPKPAFSKAVPPQQSTLTSGTGTTAPNPASNAAAPQRSTLADWAPTEEDEYLYSNVEKRGRGGRGRKKKKHDESSLVETDWDELYDPARPTNVEEYLRSDERIREVREWKAVLYAHRRRRRGSYDSEYGSDEEEEEDEKRGMGSTSHRLPQVRYTCRRCLDPELTTPRYRPVCSSVLVFLCPSANVAAERPRRCNRRRRLCASAGIIHCWCASATITTPSSSATTRRRRRTTTTTTLRLHCDHLPCPGALRTTPRASSQRRNGPRRR